MVLANLLDGFNEKHGKLRLGIDDMSEILESRQSCAYIISKQRKKQKPWQRGCNGDPNRE